MLEKKELEEIIANANLEFNDINVKNEMIKLTEKFFRWEYKTESIKDNK